MLQLHPAIVHFPIALLLLAAFFGILSMFGKRDFWKDLAIKFFITGVILTPLAVLTGIIEALHLNHNEAIHKILIIHQYNGFGILAFYSIAFAWYWFHRKMMENKEYVAFVFALCLGGTAILFQGYLGRGNGFW